MLDYEDKLNPAELLAHMQKDISASLRVLFRVIQLLSHLLSHLLVSIQVIYYYTVTIPCDGLVVRIKTRETYRLWRFWNLEEHRRIRKEKQKKLEQNPPEASLYYTATGYYTGPYDDRLLYNTVHRPQVNPAPRQPEPQTDPWSRCTRTRTSVSCGCALRRPDLYCPESRLCYNAREIINREQQRAYRLGYMRGSWHKHWNKPSTRCYR